MDENRDENMLNENDPTPVPPQPAEPTPAEPTGYTVTPQGGYYEEPARPAEPEPQPEPQPKPQAQRPNVYDTNPYPPVPPVKKKKKKTGWIVVAVLLAAIIGFAAGFAALQRIGTIISDGSEPSSDSVFKTGEADEQPSGNVTIDVDETVGSIAAAVAKKCSKSVVGIRTTTYVQNFFYGETEATGEGSGVIYSKDGYIITNYHVIKSVAQADSKAKLEVYIGSADTKPYDAQIVGYNISTDLAVLKINAKNLKAIEIGKADNLEVGQYVVSIGSPGGLDFMGSVTYGIISGLNRKVSSDSDVPLIQTDAAINPGNSGGALLNEKGQLIGINSSKIVSTEYEGMGFAIPVNVVLERCKKIIERQGQDEPYIGITVSMKYTAETLQYYGYPAGAVVSGVDEGSPAAVAGIERGDIVTEFDGKAITDPALLVEYISDHDPGDTVTLKIYRSGRNYSTTIKVGSNG